MSEHSRGRRSIPFIVHNAGDGLTETGNIIVGHQCHTTPRVSTLCEPDAIACDHNSQAFPAAFHTGSDQMMLVGTRLVANAIGQGIHL